MSDMAQDRRNKQQEEKKKEGKGLGREGDCNMEHVVGQDTYEPNADVMEYEGGITKEGMSQNYKGVSDKNVRIAD